MPNNGRLTLCPYYRDEKNLSISCEDIYRTFRWPAQKNRWLDQKCDKDWESCPYAQELNRLYSRMGENKNMNEIEKLKHQNAALERELRKVSTAAGKGRKREAEKDEKIRDLQGKNRYLEKKYHEHTATLKEMDLQVLKARRLLDIYECRLAYLMSEFAGGTLDEAAMVKWVEKNEFKIIGAKTREDEMRGKVVSKWKVEVREIGSESGEHAAGDKKAGESKTGGDAETEISQ